MWQCSHVPWTKFAFVYLSLSLAPPSSPPAIHLRQCDDFTVESFPDSITDKFSVTTDKIQKKPDNLRLTNENL